MENITYVDAIDARMRRPLEYTVEQADVLWKLAVSHFKYDGPFTLQVSMDMPKESIEILRERGFKLDFVLVP